MLTREFYFDLPEELIAQVPSDRRGDDRLLLLDRDTGVFEDTMMRDFPSLIPDNSVLVVNNSRVRKARTYAVTENGGSVEFLFLEENEDHTWVCMCNRNKKQKEGRVYTFMDSDGNVVEKAVLTHKNDDGSVILSFDHFLSEDFFTACGHVPLPPYIKREDTFADENRYQTVYSKNLGSVASPTAGLHFTPEILEEIRKMGIEIHEVTLHVGPGTFLPVRSENVEDHHMHYERYTVSEETAAALNKAKRNGKQIVAVGTTSVRTLESASDDSGVIKAGTGRTNIFIRPGYEWKVVDSLLTNFHTPESTLLMLVSALAGKDHIMSAYEHAIKERYRFFSYGDAMFIRRK